jgi:hypothetical protein
MKRIASRVLALLVTLVLALGVAGAAHADQKKLKLASSQAGPYADNLSAPLFSGTYVPGTVTSRLWVKNNSSSTARVTIALVDNPNPNALERALSFTAGIGGTTTSTPVPIYQSGKKKNECRTLVTGPTLDGGKTQEVDVSMIMDDTALPNQSASFSFVVTLSQVANKGQVDVCGPQSPGGTTAFTVARGTPTTLAAFVPASSPTSDTSGRALSTSLGAAAMVLVAGMVLEILRRRRRENA